MKIRMRVQCAYCGTIGEIVPGTQGTVAELVAWPYSPDGDLDGKLEPVSTFEGKVACRGCQRRYNLTRKRDRQ